MHSVKILVLFTTLMQSSYALERIGRLGLGFSTQPQNDITALSFKIQRSKSFAFGGYFGVDTNNNGGWAGGVKLYRHIFDEPYITFYGSALLGLLNKKISATEDSSGFQFDGTFGVEFSFERLQSIGISTEFGVSIYKIDDFNVATTGSAFLVALFHFYL